MSSSMLDRQEALSSVASLQQQSVQPDVRMHNAVLCACRRSGSWEEALQYFDRLEDQNVVILTTLLGTMGDVGRWQDALEIWQDMLMNSLDVDQYTSSTMMEALRNSGQWQWTLWLLTEMLTDGPAQASLPAPDTVSFNIAISASAESGDLSQNN